MALSSIELEMIEVLWLLGCGPTEISRRMPAHFAITPDGVNHYIKNVFRPMAKNPGYKRPPLEHIVERRNALFGLTGLPGGPSVEVPAGSGGA